MGDVDLARMPLFEGLDEAALAEIRSRMQPRRFQARSFICRQGEPGDSLLLIQRGLAQVYVDEAEGAIPRPRLRRGDVIGEIALLTGEPRSANVRASVTTEALELSREAFGAIVARYPPVLVNLSRILSRRLARPLVQPARNQRRGEAVALVVGPRGAPLLMGMIAATRAASPGSIAALDLTATLSERDIPLEDATVEGVLTVLDDLLTAHATVVAVAAPGQEDLGLLLEHVDRTVIVGSEVEVKRPVAIVGPTDTAAEVILLAEDPPHAPRSVGGVRVIKALDPEQPAGEIAWLGRHLSRTKLGLALGAGGAKGYAHVAALQVLQDAGYTVDYVAGSSIGALIGAWLALGMDAAEIEATMRRTFTPETVAAMFQPALSGVSAGGELMARLWRETTGERSFSDLTVPFVAMAVDLNTDLPTPIREGPLWQALLASMAVPGLLPPYERGEQRLVDGVALVPVPTPAVIEAGADVVVSIDIMSRQKMAAWPDESPSEPQGITGGAPPRSGGPGGPVDGPERRMRTLDALMDVMELTWRDSSAWHAALADVVITPRFGPGGFRAFHLANRFMAAGREAAEQQLAALQALARPQARTRLPGGGTGAPEVIVSSAPKDREAARRSFAWEDLEEILVGLVGLPAGRLPRDGSALLEGLGLDSIALLEAQIELEQRYGFRISSEDAQRLRTIGEVIEYVNRRLRENG